MQQIQRKSSTSRDQITFTQRKEKVRDIRVMKRETLLMRKRDAERKKERVYFHAGLVTDRQTKKQGSRAVKDSDEDF